MNLRKLPDNVVATYDGTYKYENWDVYISQGNSIDRTYDYLNNECKEPVKVCLQFVHNPAI